jgi:phospholipid-transporting ATPase
MQTFKSISISGGKPVMAAPLGLVIFASMLKDAYEDRQRHMADRDENEKQGEIYDVRTKTWAKKAWQDMKPGMLVKIYEDEFIPADVIVMNSTDPKGGLFVETKNLDGETNLKAKSVSKPIND